MILNLIKNALVKIIDTELNVVIKINDKASEKNMILSLECCREPKKS